MNEQYIVVGTGSLTVEIAEYLLKKKCEVKVYEMKLSSYSTVKEICQSKAIAYSEFDKDKMTMQLLSDLKIGPCKIISAINTYIFPKEIVEHSNFEGINYHNALLPAHRGMNAESWVIYEQEEKTGITWHCIAAGVDKGEIIIQKSIPLDNKMTSRALLQLQANTAYKAFCEFIESWMNGILQTYPQMEGKSVFHPLKKIPNEGFLDWNWDMNKMCAFVRAMDYGIVYTLGKPKLITNQGVFEAGRYRIKKTDKIAKKDVLEITENSIILEKEGSSLQLVFTQLMNLKSKELVKS